MHCQLYLPTPMNDLQKPSGADYQITHLHSVISIITFSVLTIDVFSASAQPKNLFPS